MEKINFKQITGDIIDLSVSDKFVEHNNKSNSFSDFIINNEVNVGIYDEDLFNNIFVDNPVVIDAGANVGLFALYVLPKSKKVYCIEPTESHFNILKDLVDRFYKDKVSYHNIALSNANGFLNFQIIEHNTTENKLTDQETGLKVKCLTLKSFFEENNINQVDLLKLDIEGGEDLVLMKDDTVDEILLKCRVVYVETHPYPHGNIDENKLVEKMTNLGFESKIGKRASSFYFFK